MVCICWNVVGLTRVASWLLFVEDWIAFRLLQFCEPILAIKYWILRNQTQSSASHERKLCWKNDHLTCEAVAIPRKKSGLQRGASQPHGFVASKFPGQGATQRYRKGHGFDFRWSSIFFRPHWQLLKLLHNCDDCYNFAFLKCDLSPYLLGEKWTDKRNIL